MKYALLIYGDESQQASSTAEQQAQVMDEYQRFTQRINESGNNLGGEALQGSGSATTVRVREGSTLTIDGPFAETTEQLGGFYLIEAADLDEAIAIAAELPGSWYGSVEVRPVWDWESAQQA